ncbi:MAG TPA: fumarylacetoacetate hydrolase family protein [Candidatus Coprocola pullicola]|nr:fumarylacetoacetate hydrolase family protein [Candidatus Coprocola pullicola]
MKLFTYVYEEKQQIGVLSADEKTILPIEQKDMQTLIENWSEQKQKQLKELSQKGTGIDFAKVQLKAPIPSPKQDVICLGINYMAHAEESARYKEEAFGGERPKAIYFSKRVNEAVADKEPIQGHFDIVDSLDYEVELAVVIGKNAKNVKKEDAFDYVFGYTILNDVSARNLQTSHKQWYFGKSLDGFTPIGPCIVTKEDFQNPPALYIRSYVNGELRQNSTTDLLIFDIAHVISELSQGMTLLPGTIIAMGTPAGVGMGFVPPNFLKAGDEVKCEIEGIGTLTNIVQ